MRERLVELISKVQYMGGLEEKLADYLLEKAVIVPPCKVGDRVYMVVNDKRVKRPYECNVIGFWYTSHEDCCTLHLSRYVDGKFDSSFSVRFTDIGKTVFLTKEEAERALKGDKE